MTPGPQCPAHAWLSSSQSWSEVQVYTDKKHPVTLFYCKNAATATSALIASEAVGPNVTYCSGASSGCIQGSQHNPDQSWNPYKNLRLSGRVTRDQLHPSLLTTGVPFLFCSFSFHSLLASLIGFSHPPLCQIAVESIEPHAALPLSFPLPRWL